MMAMVVTVVEFQEEKSAVSTVLLWPRSDLKQAIAASVLY